MWPIHTVAVRKWSLCYPYSSPEGHFRVVHKWPPEKFTKSYKLGHAIWPQEQQSAPAIQRERPTRYPSRHGPHPNEPDSYGPWVYTHNKFGSSEFIPTVLSRGTHPNATRTHVREPRGRPARMRRHDLLHPRTGENGHLVFLYANIIRISRWNIWSSLL